jgi:hypothetical protein
MRRIGVLLPAAPHDAEWQAWLGAFLQGLAQSGWITGRNIRIETRWTKFDPEETRKYAAELVALAPDAILAAGTSTVGPLLRLTRTVPIVFPAAVDPVAGGLVVSLARPGGVLPRTASARSNRNGFILFYVLTDRPRGIVGPANVFESPEWIRKSNRTSLFKLVMNKSARFSLRGDRLRQCAMSPSHALS